MKYLIHFSDGSDAYLAHHGILGQRWGVRRYQNPDGTLTNAGKARLSKNKDYKSGLVKKANEQVSYYSKNRDREQKNHDDLESNGVNSKAYRNWKNKQDNKRRDDYNSTHVQDYSESMLKLQNDASDRANADTKIKELMKNSQSRIDKYEKEISKWSKVHSDLMNLKVDALTSKDDIKGVYKQKSQEQIDRIKHAKKVAMGAAAVGAIVGVGVAYKLGKDKYLSDIIPERATDVGKGAYTYFMNAEHKRYGQAKMMGEFLRDQFRKTGDTEKVEKWVKALAVNEELHRESVGKADRYAELAYTEYVEKARKANAFKVANELVKEYGADAAKGSLGFMGSVTKAAFSSNNIDAALKIISALT